LKVDLEIDFHFKWGNKWPILICLQKSFLYASRLIDELATKDFDDDLPLTFNNFNLKEDN
jgi:hypothetical protein